MVEITLAVFFCMESFLLLAITVQNNINKLVIPAILSNGSKNKVQV